MTVTNRPLSWDDVDASISLINGEPWIAGENQTRVYAKLRHASWVSVTMWLDEPDLTRHEMRVVIMLRLQKRLRALLGRLRPLLVVEDSVGITREQPVCKI